jgi:hypothetical protein
MVISDKDTAVVRLKFAIIMGNKKDLKYGNLIEMFVCYCKNYWFLS